METTYTDVLVIGSGFGAAAPALRFSEAGYRVVVVEKGPEFVPGRDARQTQDPNYLRKYLKGLSSDNIGVTYAEALGGGSGFYEMVSLRAPTVAFAQRDAHGRRMWPDGVDRETLDPFYDVAEKMLRVEQIPVEEVPKSGQVFALMMKNLGYSCDRARYAVRGCQGSGFCVTGCIFGAKQSLHMNYLPNAMANGAVVKTELEALHIRPLPSADPNYRYEVVCRATSNERQQAFRAKWVFLGGGTVGTAKLLLASRRYMPRLSAQVGHNIAFNGSVKAVGLLPESFPAADMFVGRSHPGMISYHFLESHGVTIATAKPMPLQLVSGARLSRHVNGDEPSYWGASNAEMMKHARERMIVLYTLGLTPPAATITLDDDGKAVIALKITDELRSYHSRFRHLLETIMQRNGCEILDLEHLKNTGEPHGHDYFSTAHQTGSCRMADSPAHGVTDGAGQVFGYPGLYVTDGASIPSSLAVNTSLTILANAERISAGVLAGLRVPMT